MSIKIIIQNNPFSTKYEEKKMEVGITLQGIADSLNLDPLVNTALMMVEDDPARSLDYVPKENETVLIKIVPAGDANIFSNVVGTLIMGLGVAALFIPGLNIGVGAAWFLIAVGSIAWSDEIADMMGPADVADPINPPTSSAVSYLRGGTNISAAGHVVPLILGKHRYYPMQIAAPSITYLSELSGISPNIVSNGYYFSDTQEYYDRVGASIASFRQQINQLYLLGHKEVKPISTTYKRGDTKITNLVGTVITENALTNYGTKAKKFINVSKTLGAYDSTGYKGVEVVLQSGIIATDFTIILPTFWAMSSNGDNIQPTTFIRVELKNKNTNTIVYKRTHTLQGTRESMTNVVPPVAVTIPVAYVLDEAIVYSLTVTRGADDITLAGTDDTTGATGQVYKGSDVKYSTSMMLASVNCYTDKAVISAKVQSDYSYIDVQLTDESKLKTGGLTTALTGEINDINVVVQTQIPIYSGTGSGPASWATSALTSNPAALFLYVLQGSPNARPVEDVEIDWPALEAWYTFCVNNSFECNIVLDKPGAVEEVLKLICTTGRASFLMGETYSVIVDTTRTFPMQLITDKNSFGLSLSKSTAVNVHGYSLSFIDASADYQSNTGDLRIYRSGYNADGSGGKKIAKYIEKLAIPGITDVTQLKKLARYLLSSIERRNSTISVTMDWEHLFANVGDRVTVAYDIILLGIANGRLKEVTRNGSSQVISLLLDEEVAMEVGKDYGVTIRYASGSQQTLPLVNSETTTQLVTLLTPTTIDLEIDDLYAFGISGKESGDFLIVGKSPGEELKAQLTLVPYAPEVFDMTDLPAFVSNITLPNDFGQNNLITQIFNPEEIALKATSGISNLDALMLPSTKYGIKSTTPVASYLRNDVFEFKLSEFNLWFINKDDLKLYSTGVITVDGVSTLRINKELKSFDILEDESIVVYSDMTTGNTLWKYDTILDVHTQLTTVAGTSPVILGDTLFYINYEDNNYVYSTSIEDGGNGTSVLNFPTTQISVLGSKLLWIDPEFGNVVINDLSLGTPDIKGELYLTTSANSVIASYPNIWYDTINDVVPVYVDANTNMSYTNKEAFYGDVIKHAMNSKGDYAFLTTDGALYFVSLFNEQLQARMETSTITDGAVFTGDILAGDIRIRNISSGDISKMVVNDDISGIGITTNTKVTFVGSNYIVVSKPCTLTILATSLVVAGTRLVLNANRVIIPGTLTAGLVESDFYSSIARVPDGFPNAGTPLYFFDNATGIMRQYNNEGVLLQEFDPTTGLTIQGDATFSGDLSAAGGDFKGTLSVGTKTGDVTPGNPGFYVDTDGSIICNNLTANSGTFSGDVEIESDVANRNLSLGSKGLLVKDSNGIIVHDISTQTITTDQVYMGHLMFSGGISAFQVYSGAYSGNSWIRAVTSPEGNNNAKGALFSVIVIGDAGDDGAFSYFGLRPFGTSWTLGTTGTAPSLVGRQTADSPNGSTTITGQLTCPFGTGGDIELRWAAVYNVGCNIYLKQIGVYV